jgi:hypothetical protein
MAAQTAKTEAVEPKKLTQASARKEARQIFGAGCLVTKTREVVYRYRILIPNKEGAFTIAGSATTIEEVIKQAQTFATSHSELTKERKENKSNGSKGK